MNKNSFNVVVIVFLLVCAPLGAQAIEGFPGSTWGELRWELPREAGDENLILDGWIEQGIDWHRWGNVRLNTFATIRYKWDSERLDWNNSLGPGLGVALNLISAKGNHMKLGAEYIWERFYESNRTEQKGVVFLRWFQYWDLKKR